MQAQVAAPPDIRQETDTGRHPFLVW